MDAAVSAREPAAGGTFYPSDPEVLARTVDGLLASARTPSETGAPVALVVPHAGYAYSGPVAATAYALLRRSDVARVAVFGPAHFVPLRGTAVPGLRTWRTPLGGVTIDPELREAAIRHGALVDDAPHAPEHSLEVQLPFLQRVVGDRLSVLPVAVGFAAPAEVADAIAAVLSLALVVVSTDLSHYLDDAAARRRDRRTADAVVARDPDAIGADDACGAHALRGLLELARREDLQVRLLELRTSADTAGDPWRVVGYGAFAVTRPG